MGARTEGDRLRVAAVGLGWVTTHRHIPWLRRAPTVELIGVIDPHPIKVASALRRFHLRQGATASRPQDVPWLDEVEAVTIGTPPRSHYTLVKAFLDAGKHVLVEKPMAMTPAEARELAQHAEQAGKTLAVVHNFQFARSVTRLRALLDAGKLGALQGVFGVQLSNPRRRLPTWCEDLPLGLFYDEAPHLLYLMRRVVEQEPTMLRADVLASTAGRQTPSLVDLLLTSGQVPVKVTMHFEAPVSEWHLAVLGSERVAVADVFRDVLVVARNDGRHLGRHILQTSADAFGSHWWGVAKSGALLLTGRLAYGNDHVIARFAEACRSGKPPRGISAQDGLRIVQLQHDVLQAARARQAA